MARQASGFHSILKAGSSRCTASPSIFGLAQKCNVAITQADKTFAHLPSRLTV